MNHRNSKSKECPGDVVMARAGKLVKVLDNDRVITSPMLEGTVGMIIAVINSSQAIVLWSTPSFVARVFTGSLRILKKVTDAS